MKLSQKSLGRLRSDLILIAPEAAGILEDILIYEKSLGNTKKEGKATVQDSLRDLEFVRGYLRLLLEKRYDSIVKILSVLYEIDVCQVEQKTMEEILEMITDTLQDEGIMRFFPQFGRWGRKTVFDI